MIRLMIDELMLSMNMAWWTTLYPSCCCPPTNFWWVWVGGPQDFRDSSSPVATNWILELTETWLGFDLKGFGTWA